MKNIVLFAHVLVYQSFSCGFVRPIDDPTDTCSSMRLSPIAGRRTNIQCILQTRRTTERGGLVYQTHIGTIPSNQNTPQHLCVRTGRLTPKHEVLLASCDYSPSLYNHQVDFFAPMRRRQEICFLFGIIASTSMEHITASTRIPFGSFSLSFHNLVCGEKPWRTAESIRSGAEDCLRAFECEALVDQPYFIGLGNADCQGDHVQFRGGVMQFENNTDIPNDVEPCLYDLLTSSECVPIFQGHLPDVGHAPIYIGSVVQTPNNSNANASIGPNVSSSSGDNGTISSPSGGHGETKPTSVVAGKKLKLPTIPIAAAAAGAAMLLALSSFIIYRKSRSAKSVSPGKTGGPVPISSMGDPYDRDAEMGTSLKEQDSLQTRATLQEMLRHTPDSSSMDMMLTPETIATTESFDRSICSESDEGNRRTNRKLNESLTHHAYDTRLLLESKNSDDFSLSPLDLEQESPVAKLLAEDGASEAARSPISSWRKTSERGEGVLSSTGVVTSSNCDDNSQEDPELVFFNGNLADDEADSVLEVLSENNNTSVSSSTSDREFEPDKYWDPDDTSVSSMEGESFVLNEQVGESSYRANLLQKKVISHLDLRPLRPYLESSSNSRALNKRQASASSLPSLLDERDEKRMFRKRSSSYGVLV